MEQPSWIALPLPSTCYANSQPVIGERSSSISETLDHGSQGKLEDALRAIDDTNTTIYSLGFSTTKADMKHQAEEFNADLTPAPAHGCLAKDQSNGSDTHPVQVPDGKGNNRAMQTFDCLTLLAPPLRAAEMAAMAALDGMHRNVPRSSPSSQAANTSSLKTHAVWSVD